MLRPVLEAEAVQIFHSELMALVAAHSLVEERELDVLDGRLETDEIEGLEDKAYHPVAVVGGLALAQVLDELAVQPIFTGIIVVQDTEDIEQGGLAGAGSAHNGNELPLVYGEVYSFQYVERLSIVVRLVDAFQFYQHLRIYYSVRFCKSKKNLLINNNLFKIFIKYLAISCLAS